MRRALIVGCGYVGERLGGHLLESGLEVYGTTRRRDRGERLREAGIHPIVGDLEDREVRRQLDRLGANVAFYLVPPQRDRADPLPAVLESLGRAPLDAFVYGSSTSVYGDRGGDWVDETSAVRPAGPTGEMRYSAERVVVEATWEHQMPARICRIAGIYGPGRTLRRSLEAGSYLLIRGHDTWVNRIHVEDLARGLSAVGRPGHEIRVYNMVDDEPHRGSAFAELAARLQELPPPTWVDLAEAEARYGEARLRRKLASKRVSNRRLRDELEFELRYPTYRQGLPASVSARRGP